MSLLTHFRVRFLNQPELSNESKVSQEKKTRTRIEPMRLFRRVTYVPALKDIFLIIPITDHY
jgi:hypothetical protein